MKEFQMGVIPVFLSVVFVVRNQSSYIRAILTDSALCISTLVSDYEIIIVDNASEDDSIATYKNLTGENGLPNLQVYALTKEVDTDTASWVGLENALGDFVVVIDPLIDDIAFLPEMLDKAVSGADVVFASNAQANTQSLAYQCAYAIFNVLYKRFNGIHLANEAPQYRFK
jgi:polyisoprenyl-phosphate glycosyltransferase